MKPLKTLIALQVVTFILGVLLSIYSNSVSFPLLAMLLWGGEVSLIMAVLVMTGKCDVLYQYAVRGSMLSMVFINMAFMLSPII